MNERLVNYIESSFLKEMLSDENITDISYNGEFLFYQHNKLGRMKSDIIITPEEASDFLRQIANISEKQFSYTQPILDVSVYKYRINGVHQSLVRVNNEKRVSFSIRIASLDNRIKSDNKFFTKEAKEIVFRYLGAHKSIVISGPTGSGKTELQKYLLESLSDNSRIIIIDNIQELEFIRNNQNLDITTWQVNEKIIEGSFSELIRNALRNNPDWLVVAESRGKEMNEVFSSVLTGHPIITTMHSEDVLSIPHRIAKMVEMSDSTQPFNDIIEDVLKHIPCYIFLNHKIDKKGGVKRYIESIAISENNKLKVVYRSKDE